MNPNELFETSDKLSKQIVGKACQLAMSLNREKVIEELIAIAYQYIENSSLIIAKRNETTSS